MWRKALQCPGPAAVHIKGNPIPPLCIKISREYLNVSIFWKCHKSRMENVTKPLRRFPSENHFLAGFPSYLHNHQPQPQIDHWLKGAKIAGGKEQRNLMRTSLLPCFHFNLTSENTQSCWKNTLSPPLAGSAANALPARPDIRWESLTRKCLPQMKSWVILFFVHPHCLIPL